ncbi:hypothetical protein [Rubritalea tangerina]|uniref:hypothetical protein n=1 Tax=Rubritalea tangerina TaxID=430798 RepID=UPI00361A9260
MAVADRAWVIDSTTGERVANLKLTASERDTHDWGFIANDQKVIIGSTVPKGAHFNDFWGGDKCTIKLVVNKQPHKIVSDKLFAYAKSGYKGLWAYGKGLIVNSTITLDQNRLYFVECTNPDIKADSNGRVSDNRLWIDAKVVCLNATTGKRLWHADLPKFDNVTAEHGFLQSLYGQMTQNGYLLVGSEGLLNAEKKYARRGQFVYFQFDDRGKLAWREQNPWAHDHHGAHMVHPLVFDDEIYVYPNVVSVNSGKTLSTKMSGRSGCPTIVGFKNGILQRANPRVLAIWSKETKRTQAGADSAPPAGLISSPPKA